MGRRENQLRGVHYQRSPECYGSEKQLQSRFKSCQRSIIDAPLWRSGENAGVTRRLTPRETLTHSVVITGSNPVSGAITLGEEIDDRK